MVELPRNLELEFVGVTLCGDASVFSADSDIDMLGDIVTSVVGVATRDVPVPLSCSMLDMDQGRALLPARFLRSWIRTKVTP